MKSIYLGALCAMTAIALGCSSSGDDTSPRGSDASGSGAESLGLAASADSGVTSGDAPGSSITTASDAGAVDAGESTAPFLGIWPGNFSMNENCPTSPPTMGSWADTLVITAGPAEAGAGVISVLTENGCVFEYTVAGDIATALPNQVCQEAMDASVTEDLSVFSRTLTVGGGELNEIGSVTVTRNRVTCSDTEQGTYAQ